MTIHVSKDAESAINAAVQSGRFTSAEEMVDQLVAEYAQRAQQPASREVTAPTQKPIWELVADLRRSVPPEELAKLPQDGAAQLDHYLYGTPKRPPA